jgi:cobalt-zinc-cadmium efflux system protein
LAKRTPTSRTTYGFGRSTILAALVNGSLLMAGVGAIAWESVQRLMHPHGVQGGTVMIVAACGVVINALTALMFFRDRAHDLNVRGAFAHMAADALTSLGVVVSGALMLWLGWLWLDPVVSLVIAALLVWGTWGLLREATMLAMDAVPAAIDPTQVQAYLLAQPHVEAVHDLHIWAMSTTETALTAHLVMSTVPASDEMLQRVTRELEQRFHIAHATIQFEHGDGSSPCAQMHHAGGAAGR